MSIVTLRQKLASLPGSASITMKYAESGKVAVYTFGDNEYRFDASLSEDEVVKDILAAASSE